VPQCTVMEVAVLVGAIVGSVVGGIVGVRRSRRIRAAVERVKELRSAFHQLEVSYVLAGERDALTIAKIEASPLLPTLKATFRHVGDRVYYSDGAPTGAACRIFLDATGKIVAALVQAPGLEPAACHMYSFAPNTEYWTLPYQYRGLAMGPSSRVAAADWTAGSDALLQRHREIIREVDDVLTMSSADDVVAQWKRFFRLCVEWRGSQEAVALFEADALSLAGGDKRIAKRIAKRLKQALPSARVLPPS
jgi:hypothetical protein